MIVFFDHEDSFAGNLVHALRARNCPIDVQLVLRDTSVSLEELDRRVSGASGVVLSPGPGEPSDYPTFYWMQSVLLRKRRGDLPTSLWNLPILGVCLGHQMLLTASGAPLRACPGTQLHGRTRWWQLSPSPSLPPAFQHISVSSQVVFYNSLEVPLVGALASPGIDDWFLVPDGEAIHPSDSAGSPFAVGDHAEGSRGLRSVVFAAHREEPWFGVQFHPESYASPCGAALLDVFAAQCHKASGAVVGISRALQAPGSARQEELCSVDCTRHYLSL
jgi:anthranilate/para-aminobenzoate synthase component II